MDVDIFILPFKRKREIKKELDQEHGISILNGLLLQ